MGKHEDLRSLVHEMKRHGFSQYRKTNHGWLYGFQEFRFHLPHSLTQGGHIDQVADAWARWQKLKTEVLGANPGLKLKAAERRGDTPDVVEQMEPVQDIEDVLLDGGTAGADSEAMNLADEGSIPSPPATPEPALHIPALDDPNSKLVFGPEGHLVKNPNAEETTTMPAVKRRKDGKRMPDPWTCDKCGKTFGQPGRHRAYCTGTAKPEPNGRSKHGSATIIMPQTYSGTVELFEKASKQLSEEFRALITERNHYKTERDELAKKLEGLRGLLK